MRWFFIALIWLLNGSMLIVFTKELFSNFREKSLLTIDDFTIKNSVSIWSIVYFGPLGWISYLLSAITMTLDGSEPWYAYLIILFFVLVLIVLCFAILDLIRWRVVIKDGKIEHYTLSKVPFQSFEIDNIHRVDLEELVSKRWRIKFYQDEQRPIWVSEYYSKHAFSKRRKGFDLLFDLLEDKMLPDNVTKYRKQKESRK